MFPGSLAVLVNVRMMLNCDLGGQYVRLEQSMPVLAGRTTTELTPNPKRDALDNAAPLITELTHSETRRGTECAKT